MGGGEASEAGGSIGWLPRQELPLTPHPPVPPPPNHVPLSLLHSARQVFCLWCGQCGLIVWSSRLDIQNSTCSFSMSADRLNPSNVCQKDASLLMCKRRDAFSLFRVLKFSIQDTVSQDEGRWRVRAIVRRLIASIAGRPSRRAKGDGRSCLIIHSAHGRVQQVESVNLLGPFPGTKLGSASLIHH